MKEVKDFDDCTPKEQLARWEHVEIVLEGLTPHERENHWGMGDWASKNKCGTIACAAGHCGFNPWFRRHGFELYFEKSNKEFYLIAKMGDFKTYDISYVVQRYFGYYGTHSIFYNVSKRSVSQVIKEVREYIKDLKEEHSKAK